MGGFDQTVGDPTARRGDGALSAFSRYGAFSFDVPHPHETGDEGRATGRGGSERNLPLRRAVERKPKTLSEGLRDGATPVLKTLQASFFVGVKGDEDKGLRAVQMGPTRGIFSERTVRKATVWIITASCGEQSDGEGGSHGE